VASFFVSRVDGAIDPQLEKLGKSEWAGKAAIANAKVAYELFESFMASPRVQALKAKGAQVQRPLWASTSTKNPKYRDVIYVEELIGPLTVNTLPPQTLAAFRDHGVVRVSIKENVSQAKEVLSQLEKLGISMAAVTRKLEEDGIKSFSDSYDVLIKSIDDKRKQLKTVAR